ncbi:hypothetical protein [Shewanella sp. YQ_9]|uniref:hypothetical protein n=1 Tax=Shewanella sp. YQ_9 TaxID=3367231 RepID=UPI00370B95F7
MIEWFWNFWNNIKQYRLHNKRLLKYLLIAICVYLVWVSFWMMYANIWCDDLWFDVHFPNRAKPSDFSISYAASSLDNLIFFVLIGVLSILISLKNPKNDGLQQKVSYIFPKSEHDEKLYSHLSDSISSLACITTKVDRQITFLDACFNADRTKTAIKIYNKSTSHIKNIFNNHDYIKDSPIYIATADDLSTDFCDIEIFGEIHELSIINNLDQGSESCQKENLITGLEQLKRDQMSFEQKLDMKLAPGQTLQFMTGSWMWQPINEETNMSFTAARYIAAQEFTFVNRLKCKLELKISGAFGSESLTLESGSNTVKKFSTMRPDDKLKIQIVNQISEILTAYPAVEGDQNVTSITVAKTSEALTQT